MTRNKKLFKNAIYKVIAHILLAIAFLGFWMPFSISHESNELPIIGLFTLAFYMGYYLTLIFKLIKINLK